MTALVELIEAPHGPSLEITEPRRATKRGPAGSPSLVLVEAVPSLVGSGVRAGVALLSLTWRGRSSTGGEGPPGRPTRLDGINSSRVSIV